MAMRRILIIALSLLLAVSPAEANPRITSIIDGDTIKLGNGTSVRLLQIDTPELRGNECYATSAQKALAKLINRSGKITLRVDPDLDRKDRYGRLLRYLFIGNRNINIEMVRIGAAAPYFYRGEEGRYAKKLMAAAESAQAKNLGVWGACPGTKLDPDRALDTCAEPTALPNNSECDPNYEGCIPLFPPDLNCTDIKKLGLAPVRVIGKDVHRLDSDGDGIGCT